MTGQARVGDIGVGTCNQHESPKNVTVTMVSGGSVLTDGLPSCTVGSVGTASCGHPAVAMTGSSVCLVDGLPSHRIGDIGSIGSGTYVIVSGSPDVIKGDAAGSTGSDSTTSGFQPWVTPQDAALQSTEDQVDITPNGSIVNRPLTQQQKELYERAGIPINQQNSNPPLEDSTVPANNPSSDVPVTCSDIQSLSSFSPSFRLSPNFLLAHVSTSCLLERGEVQAQGGFTIQQIVCNLRGVCVNILEPLTAKYGRPNINCGFRPENAAYGASKSLHKLGQAVDLQWPGLTDEQYYQRACEIRDTMVWSQIILEYGGSRPWIHIAYYAPTANRQNAMSRITVPNGYVKGIVKATNVPKVGGTRI